MKKITSTIFLVMFVFLISACQQESKTATETEVPVTADTIDWSKTGPDAKENHITFEQVVQDVENGAVFYDVRSEEEFTKQNFGLTTNFPITELEAGYLPDLPKNQKIYVHCQLGIRSAAATKILRDAGFTAVYDLGGLAQVEAIGGLLSSP
ncbi:rhodanese-like domain-containing protein [Streptococcus moroccensis]|uniref:Rhodanese-related sulfurtransferase n=1 Tax=Streptococcus moroccensis TaxID=1451356 RepID=A0ABT9YS50_9STRE|nr:rhodanese-like domain-containing protein [Streptococcus moroccensis]MDQ0222722.1 rhodanese-related sulfurtransferase [Streptococcus moroccensis]